MDLQQKMLSVTGVSLSVTLLATHVPMLVLLSAPITTPPSNSTAHKVVPVDTLTMNIHTHIIMNLLQFTSSHPGNQSEGNVSLHIPGKFWRDAMVAIVVYLSNYLQFTM